MLDQELKGLFEVGLSRDERLDSLPYRKAWAMLARRVGRPVSQNDFDQARYKLATDQFLAPFRIGGEPTLRRPGEPTEPESALYPAIQEWLQQVWIARGLHGIEAVAAEAFIVANRRNGPTNPDLVVAFKRKRPTRDIYFIEGAAFEVKKLGVDLSAAPAQASDQHRKLNQAHLVIQIKPDDDLSNFARQCEDKGLGLITFTDPNHHDSFTVRAPSKLTHHEEGSVEEFLHSRLPAESRALFSGGGT